MPLKISKEEFDSILQAIARHPAGASISELMETPELTHFKKRTLQRRLDQLIDEKRLNPRGEGRGRRYVIRETPERTSETEKPSLSTTDRDWLSPEAREIRAAITRPQSLRTPVGYRATFLDSYIPNETAYIPPELQRDLAEIGQVGLTDLPAGTYLRRVLDRLLIDLSWNCTCPTSNRLRMSTNACRDWQPTSPW